MALREGSRKPERWPCRQDRGSQGTTYAASFLRANEETATGSPEPTPAAVPRQQRGISGTTGPGARGSSGSRIREGGCGSMMGRASGIGRPIATMSGAIA
jgi:hypothetical protein